MSVKSTAYIIINYKMTNICLLLYLISLYVNKNGMLKLNNDSFKPYAGGCIKIIKVNDD